MQVSLQKVLLGFTDVDSSKWRFGEGVGWNQSEAVQADLVDAVDGLCREYASHHVSCYIMLGVGELHQEQDFYFIH